MEKITENMGVSKADVISKAKDLLGFLITTPVRANWLVQGAFDCIKDISARYASRCLPQGVSLKISRAASVVGTTISNSRFGSAILSFCSAHPAFVAGLAIITLVASRREIRDFVKTFLQLFLIDLPLIAFSLVFNLVKIIFRMVIEILKMEWIDAGRIRNFAVAFWGLCTKSCSVVSLPVVAFKDFLSWMGKFIWNHKELAVGIGVGIGIKFA
ncbi:MAG: hypothetical protein LBF42_01800 [Puniceicoccales bacterium]|jgi:hypothetical protein|nr:hypothetical protein [Puniceicoccales bacterium]